MFGNFDPDKFMDEQRQEIEMLHAENALKLTQILDLELLLYDLRLLDLQDNSPCWCCNFVEPWEEVNAEDFHTSDCIKARKATEPFWKGVKK
jgi:hypothetical protein